MNKIISYLGFAQKSNNCITGQTALKKNKKDLYLIVVCATASENLKNLAKNLATRHKCEYVVSQFKLEELLHLNDIKIVGIADESLSKALLMRFNSI